MNRPPLSSRTERGWCMVNAAGRPWIQTTCGSRRGAIDAYHEAGIGVYPDDRKRYGVQPVRCSITTEPAHG